MPDLLGVERTVSGANLVPNGGFEKRDEATKFAENWRAHSWGDPGGRVSVRVWLDDVSLTRGR